MRDQFGAALAAARSAWRFRWHAVAATWLVGLIAFAALFFIPNQYQSSARIYVDTNSVLRPLLEGITVNPNTGSQVDLVRRALLSRHQIERVIDETTLKNRIHSSREREDLLQELGREISVTADVSSPQAREANIFTIAYKDADKALAYSVVKNLLTTFLSESVGATRSDADVAQDFLRSQISDYERRLTESESRLAEFKKGNLGAMPDEKGGYFGRLQGETTALDQVQASLTVAKRRRDELRQRLTGGPAKGTSGQAETSVDGRLRDERRHLDELLLKFTDRHPDVIAVQETIGRLEAQRSDELDSLRADVGAGVGQRPASNLVTQNLQISLNEAETQVAALQAEVGDRSARVESLRRQINTLPGVEAELLRLNRDYNVTRAEYERLLQRLESARLSDAAERVDEVKFKVIDPPVEAILPASPKRALLLIGAAILSLGVGVALAWVLAQLRPVFVRAVDLTRFKGIPVYGVLSRTNEDSRERHRQIAAVILSIVLFLGVGVGLLVLHPTIEAWSTNLLVSRGTA